MSLEESWISILENKKQCATWADESVDVEIINKILDNVYKHTNSKQNKFPYNIYVVDRSDIELRKKIFTATIDLDKNGKPVHVNTQVLAPYLLIFTPRDALLNDSDIPDYNYLTRMASIEIGLSAMIVALNASVYGYSVGFCSCFNDEHMKSLQDALNTDHSILLILGIGKYEKKDAQISFIDGISYPSYISTSFNNNSYPEHTKPDKDDIIIKLYE